jgi:hypothetical protein
MTWRKHPRYTLWRAASHNLRYRLLTTVTMFCRTGAQNAHVVLVFPVPVLPDGNHSLCPGLRR